MNLDKFIILQNKIDLISREQALEQHDQIKKFLKNTKASDSPIIPTSSQLNINMDAVLDYIVNYIPEPARDLSIPLRMVVIRSFDVNKPGCPLEKLTGGVIGGTLISGVANIGDEIEIRPGVILRDNTGIRCKPYLTKIISLKTEDNTLEKAIPGGLIGVGTKMDPAFCRADKLVGQVMGKKGTLPDIFIIFDIKYQLLKKITAASKTQEEEVLTLLDKEHVLLNVGSTTTGAVVSRLAEEKCRVSLVKPVCCEIGERIAISKKVEGHWRLIGYGVVKCGEKIEPEY